MTEPTPCPACKGAGFNRYTPPHNPKAAGGWPCKACKGSGKIEPETWKFLKLSSPPGKNGV